MPQPWTPTIRDLRTHFLKGLYKHCASESKRLLSEMSGNAHPLFRTSLCFYAGLSYESIAHSLATTSNLLIPMLEMAEQHFVAALACVERGREGSAGYFNASGENCRHGMEELDFIGRGDGNLQDEEMWFDSFAAYPYHLDAFMQTLRDHAHRIHLMRERVEARKLERVEEGRLGEMERESAPKARTKRLSHRSHMLEVEQGKEAVWEERDERMRRWATRRRFSATRYQELCRKALEEIVL